LFKLYAELALYISTHDKSLKDDLHDVISSKSTKNVLKELEALSDDKHGNNVALKIVEIFIRLVKNETNTLIDKMEGFKTYKNRYLRLIEHKRANSFLSLVIGLEKNGFKADTISSLNDSNYQTLKVNTEQLISKTYEIIPFNHLWELIVDMLAEKKQVTRKAIY
jgi:chaperonin cofactor prefoldin